ncbi:MAG: class I SAM-dependent methyltransferase [Thiohalomonadales bacterium]
MDYYEKNAEAFVASTFSVDMQSIYERFLPLLPERASILDAGCGSGRDALHFKKNGYPVTAFDASANIARLAERELGQSVDVLYLQDIKYQDQFDGIWACASLLHVPLKNLAAVFHRLARALKVHGVLYCSFKYGHAEYEKRGRFFTDLDELGLALLITEIEILNIDELWVSTDRRPGRVQERWLNAILRRCD